MLYINFGQIKNKSKIFVVAFIEFKTFKFITLLHVQKKSKFFFSFLMKLIFVCLAVGKSDFVRDVGKDMN